MAPVIPPVCPLSGALKDPQLAPTSDLDMPKEYLRTPGLHLLWLQPACEGAHFTDLPRIPWLEPTSPSAVLQGHTLGEELWDAPSLYTLQLWLSHQSGPAQSTPDP